MATCLDYTYLLLTHYNVRHICNIWQSDLVYLLHTDKGEGDLFHFRREDDVNI